VRHDISVFVVRHAANTLHGHSIRRLDLDLEPPRILDGARERDTLEQFATLFAPQATSLEACLDPIGKEAPIGVIGKIAAAACLATSGARAGFVVLYLTLLVVVHSCLVVVAVTSKDRSWAGRHPTGRADTLRVESFSCSRLNRQTRRPKGRFVVTGAPSR